MEAVKGSKIKVCISSLLMAICTDYPNLPDIGETLRNTGCVCTSAPLIQWVCVYEINNSGIPAAGIT